MFITLNCCYTTLMWSHLFGVPGSENMALINKQYLNLPTLFGGRVRPWDFLSKEDIPKATS